jgi:outer membrane lipoprotein-sorting protein
VLTAIAALATLAVLGVPAHAAFERTEAEWLTHIQNYLNLITTVEASFLQASSNGEFARGHLYIERPGRLRVEYDPPSPQLIVANNGLLVYFDRKLEQATYVPLDSTPAAILLAPSIRLVDGPLKIVNFRANDGTVQLTVVEKDNPGEGSLTLVFSEPPLTLKQWMVTDAQGISTTVSLQDARFDMPIKPELFQFNDPRFGRKG